MRQPDKIIGGKDDPYLLRWYIIPRNRFFNIYLHRFLHSDDDRALHDHPWFNVSFVLRGIFLEHRNGRADVRKAGDLIFRTGRTAHRIELFRRSGDVWTLFITGPMYRSWGFHCPQGWIPWERFVDEQDSGAIGKGCNQ